MEPPAAKARPQSRPPLVMHAKLRVIGGKGFDVAVTDLTAEGCCVATPNVELRVKQPVSLKLASLDYLQGSISWSREGAAGIEFERPLYGPVVEHLQRSHLR